MTVWKRRRIRGVSWRGGVWERRAGGGYVSMSQDLTAVAQGSWKCAGNGNCRTVVRCRRKTRLLIGYCLHATKLSTFEIRLIKYRRF